MDTTLGKSSSIDSHERPSQKSNGSKQSITNHNKKDNTFNNMNSREEIEKAYSNLSDLLASSKKRISLLSTNNPSFVDFQNKYKNQLSVQIAKVSESLEDIRKYAIWDKLVIAFVGITNAGKSTIIETFRILFDESERKAALKQNPSGVDGRIIGDGRADFTRTYKEYNMSIGGKDFVLIDVPGIEGEEKVVRSEILKALGKAHCVFFVQGEGKKPDAATVLKIKGYLKDWVKVFSIYNVRGTAFNYDEVEERERFKTPDIQKVEKEIQKTMSDALGANYAGNMTIQARLALCAYAKFDRTQDELIEEQKDLLSSFVKAESMFDFSNFQEITQCVDYLSTHFTDEIIAAQRRKLYKLHLGAFKELSQTNDSCINELSRVTKRFLDCKRNISGYFSSSQNLIHSQLRQQINEMFDVLEEDGCDYIDSGFEGDQLTSEIKQDQERLVRIVEENFEVIINNEMIDLRENIENELSRLKESFSMSNVQGGVSINFDMNLDKVVGELEFGLGDLFNWGMLLGSSFAVGWLIAAGANWWNPVGWGIGAIAAIISIFGDSKEDKAKAKLREKIAEAKSEFFRSRWVEIISKIDGQLNSKNRSFEIQFQNIIDDFNSLKRQMENVMIDIKNNSLKFKTK